MRGWWFINGMRKEHGGKSKSVDDFSTRGRVIAKIQISKKKNNYSTFTSTIDQNNNFVPSEEPYISTSSEYDFRNSHVDEPSFHDSDIDLENYFYTNTVIEYVVYHFYCFLIYYW